MVTIANDRSSLLVNEAGWSGLLAGVLSDPGAETARDLRSRTETETLRLNRRE